MGEKTHEIPEARRLLPSLPIGGGVCTFDALHSHRQLWKILRSKRAYPLFVSKGNEPTLQADLVTYFADPQAQFQQVEMIARQRGRLESRVLRVSQELCSYLVAAWLASPMLPNSCAHAPHGQRSSTACCMSQSHHYPHSSLWLCSQCCQQTLFCLSSRASSRFLFSIEEPAIIHRPWCFCVSFHRRREYVTSLLG